jgi:chloramphenicol-sensitive protein RarD
MAEQDLGETAVGRPETAPETAHGAAANPAVPPAPNGISVAGVLFGLATYVYWGFQPLYFKLLKQVPPAAMVAHRTFWCAVLMVLVITVLGRWSEFRRCLSSRRLLVLLSLSSLFLATNWLIYIASVVNDRLIETSLGYFINPLFSVFLGIVFLRERPGGLQRVAIVLAAVGIVYIVCRLTHVPWFALGVAGTFGMYGLIRKVARVESLMGLTMETLILAPVTGGYLLWQTIVGNDVFGGLDNAGQVLVLASGAVTAIPLLFFGAAARRLPLSILGFLQFVAPSLQLVFAVWLFGERFSIDHAVSFGFIWTGLIFFSIDLIFLSRRMDRERSARIG